MINAPRFGRTCVLIAALCGSSLSVAMLAGCKGKNDKAQGLPALRELAKGDGNGSRRIVIDGSFEDWPAGRAVTGDADYLYFRVKLEGWSMPLQAGQEMLSLLLDADGDPSTGAKMPEPAEAGRLGVDLIAQFSPVNAEGGMDRGARTIVYDAGGTSREEKSHAVIGVTSAPTFASDEFELRIDRHSEQGRALAKGLGAAGGRVSAMFTLTDASGRIVGWSDPESASLPKRSAAEPRADAIVPAKTPGVVRVVSWNVLRSSLVNNPTPFARVLQVLDADVVLLQEWDASAETAIAWFSSTITGQGAWHARSGPGGVVIVSRWPIESLGQPLVQVDPASLEGNARPDVRFVGGLVRTGSGDVIAGSLHYKCCGSSDTSEERRRQAEARAVAAALAGDPVAQSVPMRIVGGDFNLVGTRVPLDLTAAGADVDKSDLAVAQTRVLGDSAMITWRDEKTDFPPGRLDWLAYGDAGARVVNAFVLDTDRLSDRALATMGLDRGDTRASDHLPLVVDLKAK